MLCVNFIHDTSSVFSILNYFAVCFKFVYLGKQIYQDKNEIVSVQIISLKYWYS